MADVTSNTSYHDQEQTEPPWPVLKRDFSLADCDKATVTAQHLERSNSETDEVGNASEAVDSMHISSGKLLDQDLQINTDKDNVVQLTGEHKLKVADTSDSPNSQVLQRLRSCVQDERPWSEHSQAQGLEFRMLRPTEEVFADPALQSPEEDNIILPRFLECCPVDDAYLGVQEGTTSCSVHGETSELRSAPHARSCRYALSYVVQGASESDLGLVPDGCESEGSVQGSLTGSTYHDQLPAQTSSPRLSSHSVLIQPALSHDIEELNAGEILQSTVVDVGGRTRAKTVRDIMNNAMSSVFRKFNFLVLWHSMIIAACPGDANPFKRMHLSCGSEGRSGSFLARITIPEMAKAGYTEILKTMDKFRIFLCSTMSDILSKMVADSEPGQDHMTLDPVHETCRSSTDTVSSNLTLECQSAIHSGRPRIVKCATAPPLGSTALDSLHLLPQADVEAPTAATVAEHIQQPNMSLNMKTPRSDRETATVSNHGTGVTEHAGHSTTGRTSADILSCSSIHSGSRTTGHDHLHAAENNYCVTSRKGISKTSSVVRRDSRGKPQQGGQAARVRQPPSKWQKVRTWEFGLWEFQLVVPVLLMKVVSQSKWRSPFEVTSGRGISRYDSRALPSTAIDPHQVELEAKKKVRRPHRAIPDYTISSASTGVHSSRSGSDVSALELPAIEETSTSLARTPSESISSIVKDMYPSSRTPESDHPMGSIRKFHVVLKKRLPKLKLSFLSKVLPSRGNRFSEFKQVARQTACLHVQLTTSANEIQGSSGGGRKFLEMAVTIDNVRCRVENSVWDMKKRNYKMGHFPTLIEIALTPVSCSMDDVSISLTRSSNNSQFVVTLEESLTGGGGLNLSGMSAGGDLSVAASKSTTSAVKSTPWRFEQFEAGGLGAGFSWTLQSLEGRPFDRLYPHCDTFSKYKPNKPFFHFPFTKLSPPVNPMIETPFNVNDGGVVFAGTDYPNAILWRFREQMRGAVVTWEIKGRVDTTFVSGKGFWETRVEHFREAFQHELQVTEK